MPARLFTESVDEQVANKRIRQLRKGAKRKGKTPSKARLKLVAYNIWITNAPKQTDQSLKGLILSAEKLTLDEAMSLARVRWQIELLFKLWKSHGRIDVSRSKKPWRILCEVYAKLIAMLIQHWLLLCGGCHALNRSFVKAAKTIAKHSLHLASVFATQQIIKLIEVLSIIARCLTTGSRIMKRLKQPATYQLLLDLTPEAQQFP